MDPVRLQIGAEPFPPGMKDLESLPFGGVFDRRAVPDDQPASSTTFGLGRLRLGRHQRLALGGRVDRPPKLVGDGGDSFHPGLAGGAAGCHGRWHRWRWKPW
jgi:hypothetical protein